MSDYYVIENFTGVIPSVMIYNVGISKLVRCVMLTYQREVLLSESVREWLGYICYNEIIVM